MKYNMNMVFTDNQDAADTLQKWIEMSAKQIYCYLTDECVSVEVAQIMAAKAVSLYQLRRAVKSNKQDTVDIDTVFGTYRLTQASQVSISLTDVKELPKIEYDEELAREYVMDEEIYADMRDVWEDLCDLLSSDTWSDEQVLEVAHLALSLKRLITEYDPAEDQDMISVRIFDTWDEARQNFEAEVARYTAEFSEWMRLPAGFFAHNIERAAGVAIVSKQILDVICAREEKERKLRISTLYGPVDVSTWH